MRRTNDRGQALLCATVADLLAFVPSLGTREVVVRRRGGSPTIQGRAEDDGAADVSPEDGAVPALGTRLDQAWYRILRR